MASVMSVVKKIKRFAGPDDGKPSRLGEEVPHNVLPAISGHCRMAGMGGKETGTGIEKVGLGPSDR